MYQYQMYVVAEGRSDRFPPVCAYAMLWCVPFVYCYSCSTAVRAYMVFGEDRPRRQCNFAGSVDKIAMEIATDTRSIGLLRGMRAAACLQNGPWLHSYLSRKVQGSHNSYHTIAAMFSARKLASGSKAHVEVEAAPRWA